MILKGLCRSLDLNSSRCLYGQSHGRAGGLWAWGLEFLWAVSYWIKGLYRFCWSCFGEGGGGGWGSGSWLVWILELRAFWWLRA